MDERSDVAEYLKLPEVARRLDISEKTARRMVKGGKLPAMFIGNAYRVSEEDIATYLRNAQVDPKAPGRSSVEPSFNDVLDGERREAIYGPWLKFANRYADRWQQRIETGNFDLGSVNEFIATVADLMATLHELNAAEVQELPEQPYSFSAPGAKTGAAIMRIADLIDPLITAGAAKFESSELEHLRQKHDEARRALERSA